MSKLEQAEHLFGFLQGCIPNGITLKDEHIPRLDADQAWSEDSSSSTSMGTASYWS